MPIAKSYYKIMRVLPDPDYFYIKNEYNGNNTISLNVVGSPNSTSLEYSKDKITWTSITNGGNNTLSSGESIYFRSTTGFTKDNNNRYFFTGSQNFSVGGHISSLIDYTDIGSITTIPSYSFYRLFAPESGTNKLTNAGNLDFSGIITINSNGLEGIFIDNILLTTPPDLSSITQVEQFAFSGSFVRCTSLTTPPDLSSITQVAAYGMSSCFGSCTSLTTGLDLSSLISLSTKGLENLYYGCTSLTMATAPNVSSWSTSYVNNWLNGVAVNGVVRKPANLTIPTDSTSGVPTGWTTVNY